MGVGETPEGAGAVVDEGSYKHAIGTFLGVSGMVVLFSAGTLGSYFFGTTSWLTLGPVGGAALALVGWFALSFDRLTERLSQRSGVFVGVTIGYAMALVGVFAGGHYLLAASPVQWDLTQASVHTLSDQSQKVLRGLDRPVRVTGFYETADPEARILRELVDRYQRETEQLTFRLLSPTSAIAERRRYNITDDGPRVIVETGSDDDGTAREARFRISVSELNHEELFTNALIQATQRQRPKVYVLYGHGEAELSDGTPDGLSALGKDLAGEGYDVVPMNLVLTQRVPDDAAAVVLPGPRQALLVPERIALSRYASRGGRLLLCLDSGAPHGLDELLGSFGVMANDDIVLDMSEFGRMFGSGPDTAVAVDYARHPATAPLGSATTLFPRSRSLSINPVPGLEPQSIVRTGSDVWGESDFSSLTAGTAEWDPGEVRGPVTLAVAVERRIDDGVVGGRLFEAARIVAVGDASFLSNQNRRLGANRNLALNLVGWLTGQSERVAIRPNRRGGNLILLTPRQRERIAFVLLYGMPVALLCAGLGIWLVRRQR